MKKAEAKPTTNIKLNTPEALAFRFIVARKGEIERAQAVIEQDTQALFAAVAERVEMSPADFIKDYALDTVAWEFVLRPPQNGDKK
jgi:hypothetical protein